MDFLFAGVYVVTAGWKELDGKMKLEKFTEDMKKDLRDIEFTHLDKFYQN